MNMRVLLATDLSASATIATRLVAAQRWPEATTIRVFGVREPSHGTAHDDGDGGACAFTTGVHASAETLVERGRIIEAATDLGHPADVIVAEATRFRADLVVLGSRGRGLIRSAVLGSVSARVADEAPCPVLIARHEEISGVVFGDDGATYTAEAARVLTWPAFAALPITVVSVAEIYLPFQAVAETRARFEDSVRTYLQESFDREERCQRIASEQAAALIRLGIKAKGEMRRGSPARALIAAAAARGADLILVGSRGNRGVQRMLVGSTARELLYHAPCSVLIAPGALAAQPAEGALALGWQASALGA